MGHPVGGEVAVLAPDLALDLDVDLARPHPVTLPLTTLKNGRAEGFFMNRAVRGGDERDWVIRAQMEWRRPATVEDFEHDVAGSPAPGFAMLSVTLVLVIVLVAWLPQGVIVPPWVLYGLLLIVVFFPLRWVLNRPWTVVAETDGDLTGEHPPERWVGIVSGMFRVRREVVEVAKTIQKHSLPDFDGPLHPME